VVLAVIAKNRVDMIFPYGSAFSTALWHNSG
jgi:hypothetical protein